MGQKRKKSADKEEGRADQQAIERYRAKQTRQKRQRIVLVVAIILITGVLITYSFLASQPPYPARTPSEGSIPVPTIGSSDSIPASAHFHSHLDIFLDGKAIPVPEDLGHLPSRLYALHAHDTLGIIHMEYSSVRTYTLAEVFEVWGWPLDSNQIFDKTGAVTLYVNGAQIPFDSGTHINQHDEIVLVYGAPPPSIPSTYDFASHGA